MSTPIVELTHRAFEAMNRHDLDWLVAHCDPGVERHMQGVAGEPVLYVGAAGICDYLRARRRARRHAVRPRCVRGTDRDGPGSRADCGPARGRDGGALLRGRQLRPRDGLHPFFFATDIVAALREARRVAKPGAPVVIQVWGPHERNDLEAMKAIARPFFPPRPAGAPAEPDYPVAGVLEALASEAGLTPEDAFDTTSASTWAT